MPDDLYSLFRASAATGIPTLKLKAAVVAGRLVNYGGELAGNMRVSLAEVRTWFDNEGGKSKAEGRKGRKR